MKHTKEYIEEMYNYTKELYEWDDVYDMYELKRLYNDISEKFNLDVAFWIDGCEYWWDEEIYCYVYVDYIWSIVFNWSVNHYTDHNFYKDTVNYILGLEEEGQKIKEKLLNLNKKENEKPD